MFHRSTTPPKALKLSSKPKLKLVESCIRHLSYNPSPRRPTPLNTGQQSGPQCNPHSKKFHSIPGIHITIHIARKISLLRLTYNLIDSLGEIFYVVRVQTRHGDAAVLRHVYVSILSELQDLRLTQSREGEHADLVSDVVPGTRGLEFF